jgi:molybdopterin-biosynthesis enzyme MoeA-like protein
MTVVETHHPGGIEADFAEPMDRLEREFPDVAVGSYPPQGGGDLIIRLRGEDAARVGAAEARLADLLAGGPAAAAQRLE